MKRGISCLLIPLVATFCLVCGTGLAQVTNMHLEWTRLLGAASSDSFGMDAVVFPNGDVYAVGYAAGPFDGHSNPGDNSLCVVSWDAVGNKRWSKILGTVQCDEAMAIDRDDYNVYIAGYSDGDFGGVGNLGLNDVFLVKLNTNGASQFEQLWGSPSNDYAYGVAYGPGDPYNVYVAGYTEGAFGEWPAGTTNVNNGGPDVFLTKWNPDGTTMHWTRMWGSAQVDQGRGVAVDSYGDIYVAGHTFGEFHGQTNPGAMSPFLSKFDKDGTNLWTRIWGSISSDYVEDVAIDDSGAIYVVGYTYGEFGGQTNSGIGYADAFLSVFDPNGNHLWTRIWGSPDDDYASGLALASDYQVHVSGYTYTPEFYGQTNLGMQSAFLSSWSSGGSASSHLLFGGTNETGGTSVALGSGDTIHIPGYTKSGFGGEPPVSGGANCDLFLTKISATINTNPLHVWNLGGVVMGSPAIDGNGTIYVSLMENPGNNVFGLHPDGSTQFVSFVSGGTRSSPAIGADGSVYVGTGTSGYFYAFAADLSLNNDFDLTPLAGDYAIGAPAIRTNGFIYAVSQGGVVLEIDPVELGVSVAFEIPGGTLSAPAIGSDGTIYVGSDNGYFYGFDPVSHSTQFVSFVGSSLKSSPAIGADGTIYAGCVDNKVFAFNPDGTTQRVWMTGGAVRSSPAIGEDGTIYVGCDDYKFYAFNFNGTTQRVWMTGGIIESSPAIGGDGTIYVGSDDGKLYAFNADGTTSAVYTTGGSIRSSPAIADDGTVYVGSGDSNLYAFAGTGGMLGSGPWPKFRANHKNTGLSWSGFMPGPTGLAASTGIVNQVVVSWNPVPDATDYDIWWATNNNMGMASYLTSVSMTNFNHATPTPGRSCFYWVKGWNATSQSPFSGPVSGWRAMDVTVGLLASQGAYTNMIQTTWGSVEGATGFEVWRSTSTNRNTSSRVGTTEMLQFYDSGVTSAVIYYYWVRATNIYTTGAYSAPASGYAVSDVQLGSLVIDVTPDSGAWTLTTYPSSFTGKMSGTGDYSFASVPTGIYVASFGTLDWYRTPSAASAEVYANMSSTLSGFYVPLDSDNDGLTDYDEVYVYGTDPYNPDSDGDGYSDGIEVYYGSDPLNADSYPRGELTFSSPVAGLKAKAGKRMPVVWRGAYAMGQADIILAQGTSSWSLAASVYCPHPYSSNSVRLPATLRPGTNYHVKVFASGATVAKTAGVPFGDSDLFSVVSDCKGDYDADGKSDLSMYFPPWGMWFLLRSNKGFYYQQFGWDGPTPVPADYDGDGRTDIAVHDSISGYWYILTWNYRFYWLQWGAGMKPVPADYDGDGLIDFAVYDSASGAWHVMLWSGISYSVYFGGVGYEPVPGDYDGDGLANVAVYNAQAGTWYILLASGYEIATVLLGGTDMIAMPNDYDGDGITDPAVYDPSSGIWYIYCSSRGLDAVQFGFADAIPVSGDYDGDGKSDLGVVYGPLGLWYRLLSADGTIDCLQFGCEGIMPLD